MEMPPAFRFSSSEGATADQWLDLRWGGGETPFDQEPHRSAAESQGH